MCDNMDVEDLDLKILEEEGEPPSPKAHNRECRRNRSRRSLFQDFKPGEAVLVHLQGKPGKHLVCRVAQLNAKRYTLQCKRATLLQRFVANELQHTDTAFASQQISLDRWRQGEVISVRELLDEDLDSCCCEIEAPQYHYIGDDDSDQEGGESSTAIKTPLYTLSKRDLSLVENQYAWLNDKVITASQEILAQQFPHIEGLQPPTLQQVRGFKVHRGEFVQIINVSNMHWCVTSTVGCEPGEVRVYDTMFRRVQESTISIIASLTNCQLSSLRIHMMDVGRQTNSSDCGVLSVAIAYDLCSGDDPATVVYDHSRIREHLKTSLKSCSLSRFPVQKTRAGVGIIAAKVIPLYCTCRMPEDDDPDNPYAECTSCKRWYHKACADIPDSVFDDRTVDWKCKQCK